MAWLSRLKGLVGLGPSKEEQQQELERLKQQLNVGTPIEKIQKEIEYNELFYKVYPKSITEQAYTEYMSRLNQELAAAIKEQGTPSIYEGWEPPAATAKTADREMNVLNGGKSKRTKSKRTKSKRTKSKRTNSKRTKSKSKKSKRTKSKRTKK